MENANYALGLGFFSFIFVLIIALPLYFLPSIIASKKKNKYQGGIFILNLFLGWTFLGWVLALVWSVVETRDDENKKEKKENKYDDIERLQKLKETGAISEEEFNNEKEKILKN